jgi:hypothetical protein
LSKRLEFIVDRESERRVQDLAHQLIDACREIVAAQEKAIGKTAEPLERELAAIDVATQTLFMADHLGQEIAHDRDSPVLKSRLLGVASGLGQIVGTSPDTIAMALDLASALRTVESSAFKRHADSARRAEKLRKEGKL